MKLPILKVKVIKKTLGAGMEAFLPGFPYGWTSLKDFWLKNPQYAPTGTTGLKENSSAISKSRGVRSFLVFPSVEAGAMAVATVINLRGGDGGQWFSNQESLAGDKARKAYNDVLTSINSQFINKYLS